MLRKEEEEIYILRDTIWKCDLINARFQQEKERKGKNGEWKKISTYTCTDRRGIRYLGVGVELFDECEGNSNKTEVLNSGKLEAEFSSGYGSKPLSGFHGEMEKFRDREDLSSLWKREGKKNEISNGAKVEKSGERKKVSNCSRTLANWIKICPARRSSDILGKLHGVSCTGSFSLRALRRKRGRRKKTLLRAR